MLNLVANVVGLTSYPVLLSSRYSVRSLSFLLHALWPSLLTELSRISDPASATAAIGPRRSLSAIQAPEIEKSFGDMEGNDYPAADACQYQCLLREYPIGVGTWAWGDKKVWGFKGEATRQLAEEAFNKSLECGVHLFDTASIYGYGESERILGTLLKKIEPVTRQKLVIATKYIPLPWHVNCRKQLMISLKKSLARLQLEKVDLFQIHGPAFSIRSIEHLANGLADAQDAGLCKAVGVSNFNADEVKRAHSVLMNRNVALVSNQLEFSLLRRLPELNGLMKTCSELGVLVLAYSPLAMGRLTGKYSASNPPPSNRNFGKFPMEEIEPLLEKLKEIGEMHGKTPSQVALNWIICKGAIPIPGAKNGKQAEDNAGALGWKLTSEEVEQLSKLGKEGKTNWFWQHG